MHPGIFSPSELSALSLHFALSLFSHFLCLCFPSAHFSFLSLINHFFCPKLLCQFLHFSSILLLFLFLCYAFLALKVYSFEQRMGKAWSQVIYQLSYASSSDLDQSYFRPLKLTSGFSEQVRWFFFSMVLPLHSAHF